MSCNAHEKTVFAFCSKYFDIFRTLLSESPSFACILKRLLKSKLTIKHRLSRISIMKKKRFNFGLCSLNGSQKKLLNFFSNFNSRQNIQIKQSQMWIFRKEFTSFDQYREDSYRSEHCYCLSTLGSWSTKNISLLVREKRQQFAREEFCRLNRS